MAEKVERALSEAEEILENQMKAYGVGKLFDILDEMEHLESSSESFIDKIRNMVSHEIKCRYTPLLSRYMGSDWGIDINEAAYPYDLAFKNLLNSRRGMVAEFRKDGIEMLPRFDDLRIDTLKPHEVLQLKIPYEQLEQGALSVMSKINDIFSYIETNLEISPETRLIGNYIIHAMGH